MVITIVWHTVEDAYEMVQYPLASRMNDGGIRYPDKDHYDR
jgi:hypothetical protein